MRLCRSNNLYTHHDTRFLSHLKYRSPLAPYSSHSDSQIHTTSTQNSPRPTSQKVTSNPRSTTALGTAYEATVTHALQRLGFSLVRVGKRSDCGIDLVGTWSLPSLHSSISVRSRELDERVVKIPVFIQCKNILPTRRSTPATVREVEGAFPALRPAFAIARAESAVGINGTTEKLAALEVGDAATASKGAGDGDGVDEHGPEVTGLDESGIRGAIGLLATTRPATKGVRDALGRSRMPLGYVQVVWDGGGGEGVERGGSDDEGSNTGDASVRVTQLLWNARAASAEVADGALGSCEVGLRHVEAAKGGIDEGDEVELVQEVVLLRDGHVWDRFLKTELER